MTISSLEISLDKINKLKTNNNTGTSYAMGSSAILGKQS